MAAGTGNNLRHYPKDCKITLIDLSRAMLKIASQKARRQRLEVSIQEMDAESLEFPNDAFDTVVDSLSLRTLTQLKLTDMGVIRTSGRKVVESRFNMFARMDPSILPTINLRNLLRNNDFFLSGRTEFPHLAV